MRVPVRGRRARSPVKAVTAARTIDRPRPVAGLLFFNDGGDEVGGLTYSGRERDGERRAGAQLAFDQLKQDQTVAISVEADGAASLAFLDANGKVLDRVSPQSR